MASPDALSELQRTIEALTESVRAASGAVDTLHMLESALSALHHQRELVVASLERERELADHLITVTAATHYRSHTPSLAPFSLDDCHEEPCVTTYRLTRGPR